MSPWKSCLFWKGFLPELWITKSPEEPLLLPFELLVQMQASVSSGEPSDEAGAEIAQENVQGFSFFSRWTESWGALGDPEAPQVIAMCMYTLCWT